jgi:hypothetical protein
MGNKGTYIYLDRGVLDHWTYKDKPFNRSMAWIDLLLIADHTTHTKLWRGKPTEFKRGDVNLSITELAKRWGWSRDKARRFISHLEQDNMVRVNSTTYRTTITIVKYDDFQIKRSRDKATDKATKRTSNKATDKAYLINDKGMQKEIKESAPLVSDETAALEDEEPPVPGAVRMPNGGWNYRPDLDDDEEEE